MCIRGPALPSVGYPNKNWISTSRITDSSRSSFQVASMAVPRPGRIDQGAVVLARLSRSRSRWRLRFSGGLRRTPSACALKRELQPSASRRICSQAGRRQGWGVLVTSGPFPTVDPSGCLPGRAFPLRWSRGTEDRPRWPRRAAGLPPRGPLSRLASRGTGPSGAVWPRV